MRLGVISVLSLLWILGFSTLSLNSRQVSLQVSCSEPQGCFGLIGKVLAAAPAGSTIVIGPGIFYEQPLVIDRSLALQGAGADLTKIRMVEPGAAISIHSVESVEVQISSLAVTVPFIWNNQRGNVGVGIEWVQQPPGVNKTQTIVIKDSEIISFNGVLINSSKGSLTIQRSSLQSVNFGVGLRTRGEITVVVESTYIGGPFLYNDPLGLSRLVVVSQAILFMPDESPGKASISLKNNQIHFWHIGFSAFSLGQEGWSKANALLVGNTIAYNNGPGVLLGGDTIAELRGNTISDNSDYGIALFLPPCASISSGEITAFRGKVYGEGNIIMNNNKGDLCPPDYPWPPGFRR